MSALRATLVAAGLIVLTVACIPVQLVMIRLFPRHWHVVPMRYFRMVCRIAGIRVTVDGRMANEGPLLLVANHVSWMDIVVIGSLAPLSFIAKKEVGAWPLFGLMSRLHRTLYVDRERRRDTGRANQELSSRLAGGDTVVLFAEGTSSDGNAVLPFKSAIVGAVEHAAREAGEEAHTDIAVQPLAIAYTHVRGLPIGRQQRPAFAWYGDMDLLPHLWGVIGRGPVDASISLGRVHRLSEYPGRKEMTRSLEGEVRAMFAAAISGRGAAPGADSPAPASAPYA